jgi:fanconi-associated nuclease 1
MLGQKIKHPPSTNFEDSSIRISKRLKREDTADTSDTALTGDVSPSSGDEGNTFKVVFTPKDKNTSKIKLEIPDSEDEVDFEEEAGALRSSAYKTEIETAMPFIATDKEAIEEYEASKAVESTPLDTKQRMGQRKWMKGRSSIYVDAFNLALDTVLEDEGHLFDEAEMGVFECWKELSYEAQYLYESLISASDS